MVFWGENVGIYGHMGIAYLLFLEISIQSFWSSIYLNTSLLVDIHPSTLCLQLLLIIFIVICPFTHTLIIWPSTSYSFFSCTNVNLQKPTILCHYELFLAMKSCYTLVKFSIDHIAIAYCGLHFYIMQVDLAHLLASRDQELRALSAEVICCKLCPVYSWLKIWRF